MPLQRRVPKRGFTNIFKRINGVVNIADLQQFAAGTEVTPLELLESGLVKKHFESIKLLATGEINVPLTVKVHKASAAAVSKIEAAGGRVELITA